MSLSLDNFSLWSIGSVCCQGLLNYYSEVIGWGVTQVLDDVWQGSHSHNYHFSVYTMVYFSIPITNFVWLLLMLFEYTSSEGIICQFSDVSVTSSKRHPFQISCITVLPCSSQPLFYDWESVLWKLKIICFSVIRCFVTLDWTFFHPNKRKKESLYRYFYAENTITVMSVCC